MSEVSEWPTSKKTKTNENEIKGRRVLCFKNAKFVGKVVKLCSEVFFVLFGMIPMLYAGNTFFFQKKEIVKEKPIRALKQEDWASFLYNSPHPKMGEIVDGDSSAIFYSSVFGAARGFSGHPIKIFEWGVMENLNNSAGMMLFSSTVSVKTTKVDEEYDVLESGKKYKLKFVKICFDSRNFALGLPLFSFGKDKVGDIKRMQKGVERISYDGKLVFSKKPFFVVNTKGASFFLVGNFQYEKEKERDDYRYYLKTTLYDNPKGSLVLMYDRFDSEKGPLPSIPVPNGYRKYFYKTILPKIEKKKGFKFSVSKIAFFDQKMKKQDFPFLVSCLSRIIQFEDVQDGYRILSPHLNKFLRASERALKKSLKGVEGWMKHLKEGEYFLYSNLEKEDLHKFILVGSLKKFFVFDWEKNLALIFYRPPYPSN